MKLNSLFLLAPLATGACLTEMPEAGNEEQATQEITGNWSYASQYHLDRAVMFKNCTGTRVAWNYAVTALHCDPLVGDQVNFYDAGPGFGSRRAEVAQVFHRSGATPDDTYSGDLLADVVVVRLQATGDSGTYENQMEGPSAVLAWEYSGDSVTGTKVGSGEHNGDPNPSRKLRQVNDTTDDYEDDRGRFITSDDDSNHGDSGGPFYVDNRASLPPRILGLLKRGGLDPVDGDWDLYTSMPAHLDWILQKMNYRWRGQPAQLEHRYVGTNVDTFTGSVLECQYACDRTQSCEAYNYFAGTDACALVTSVTGITDSVGYRGALQYGASSGNSNDVVGYRRSDGINVMVHKATNGRVHELALVNGQWTAWDITSNGPLAASKLSAYVRGDGTDAVVYRDASNRIIEIAHGPTGWTAYDLSQSGGGTPAGDPVAYVRADGSSAVVYRGTNDNIYELHLGTRG